MASGFSRSTVMWMCPIKGVIENEHVYYSCSENYYGKRFEEIHVIDEGVLGGFKSFVRFYEPALNSNFSVNTHSI